MTTALRNGLVFLAGLDLRRRLLLVPFLMLLLLMQPFGRGRIFPGDSGGLLAPLTADSGHPSLSRYSPGLDFYSIYDAGARFVSGANVYAPAQIQRAPYATLFRYPPVTILWLAVPLSLPPPKVAFILWVGFLSSLLLVNFVACVGVRPDLLWTWAFLWLAWAPTIGELHMGQFSLLLGSLLLWGLLPVVGGGPGSAAGWVLASLLKIYPILMAPLMLAKGRQMAVFLAVGLLVGGAAAWKLARPADQAAPLAIDQVIRAGSQPYAGAQGPQETVAALAWLASGNSLSKAAEPSGLGWVFPACLALAGGFVLLCAAAWWRERLAPSPALFGLFWLAWFFCFKDTWDHHYMIVQSLLAFLLLTGTISWRAAAAVWLCCGAPSAWLLWYRLDWEPLGLIYFTQRSAGVVLLAVLLTGRIFCSAKVPVHS